MAFRVKGSSENMMESRSSARMRPLCPHIIGSHEHRPTSSVLLALLAKVAVDSRPPPETFSRRLSCPFFPRRLHCRCPSSRYPLYHLIRPAHHYEVQPQKRLVRRGTLRRSAPWLCWQPRPSFAPDQAGAYTRRRHLLSHWVRAFFFPPMTSVSMVEVSFFSSSSTPQFAMVTSQRIG